MAKFSDVVMPEFFNQFDRDSFRETVRMLADHGPSFIDKIPEKPKYSTLKERKEFKLTIENLFRMPIGHSGDIPRHCQICQKLPTQFTVVYSESLRFCYFFCDEHFTEYINKALPEKDDDRGTKRNTAKRTDGNSAGDRTSSREQIPQGTPRNTGGDSLSQRKDGGVETTGISESLEVLSEGAELFCALVSEI